jgi:hypothetical protein
VKLPKGFGPDAALPDAFLRVLMRRASLELFYTTRSLWVLRSGIKTPELTDLYLAFTELEAPLERSRSGYLSSVKNARAALFAALPDDLKWKFSIAALGSGKEAFEWLVREAEKYPGMQDYHLVSAIKAGAGKVDSERLERLVTKFNNRELRQPLLDYINYAGAGALLVDNRWREAVILSQKIEQPEPRALLLLEAALSIAGRAPDQAAELLDLAALLVAKAANSSERAALQFSLAALYTKLDQRRAFEITLDAIATINRLTEPDLRVTSYEQRLSAGGFETSLSYTFTGFTLEELFALLGEADSDQAVVLAERVEDQALRARSLLQLSALCLKKAEEKMTQGKQKKSLAESRQQ